MHLDEKKQGNINQPACLHLAMGHLVWFDLRWKDEFVEREETVWVCYMGSFQLSNTEKKMEQI